MKSWTEALKEWNQKTQAPYRWAVPKKGSIENNVVREMMKGKKFRLRTMEPGRVMEEVDDDYILNVMRQAEMFLNK